MSIRGRLLAFVFAAAAAVATLPAETRLPLAADEAIKQITAHELRRHVEALASDEMAGRAVGHAGNERAVQYVAQALRRARVAPAADAYFHPVELYQPSLGPEARLTISGRGNALLVDLTPGVSFYPLPESAGAAVTGQLVFAGHGISAPKLRYDDYARRDVRGAIALVLDDAPESLRRTPGLTEGERTALATVERKIIDAHAHGANGLIIVRAHPRDMHFVWNRPSTLRTASYRLHSRLKSKPVAVGVLSEQAAEPIRRALSARVPLAATLHPGIVIQRTTVHNVLAKVDPPPEGSEELVVVGAHLDHDGVDDDGRVYNGADDNASGTAAVLAMAEAFTKASAAGQRPRRRVIFALWNAEEKGLLGSEAFAADPPAGRIIANVNLDMIGRGEDVPDPKDPRYRGFRRTTEAENANVVHVLGYSYSPEFAALARRANESIGLTLKEDYDRGAQGLLQRSDNWPFLMRAIPSLFFTTGLHPDYHTPDDDVERIDFAKLERITELVSRLAWLVADGEPPRFQRQ